MNEHLERHGNFSEKFISLGNFSKTSLVLNFTNITGHLVNLYDQPINKEVRVTTLWVLAVLGALGNSVVLYWLWNHRARRSRALRLFLNLTIADVLVTVCATGPQLVWEYYGREWRAGDVMCRLVKFLQNFSICASNYLIVAIALDRYKSIRRPLSHQWKALHLASGSWLLAAFTNLSSFFLFQQEEYEGQTVCRNILYEAPVIFLKVYLTTMVALVFVIPLLVISACYISIVQKISEKADEVVYQTTFSKGPRTATLALRRFPNNWLFRAKQKTSRMTFVIITSFLLCSAPYCIVEMWRMYGDASSLDAMTYSILAALAVSNSSTNPLVFMFFHFSSGVRRPSRALSKQQTGSPRTNFIKSRFHQRKVPTFSRQDKKEKTGLAEIFPDVKSKDTSMDNSCSIRNIHHQRVRAEISHQVANHLEESKEL